MANINVIRIEYELPNKPDYKWIAVVAAYTPDEAVKYLRKNLGNIKVTTIESKTRLDAISDEVRSVILKASGPKKRVKDDPSEEETSKDTLTPKEIPKQEETSKDTLTPKEIPKQAPKPMESKTKEKSSMAKGKKK